MTAKVFSATRCVLGEGPLWHPEAQALYWFDILGKRMHRKGAGEEAVWQFDEYVSAAGWVDADRLLVASSSRLFLFDTATGQSEDIVAMEAVNPVTRSNDGRADPQGGFWIGTMGVGLEPGVGAYYRYYKGELRQLWDNWSIPNATCFSPDGTLAYFSDTPRRIIWQVRLDGDGWPEGEPEVFVDLNADGLNPDGAVVDADGTLWNAQWGAGCVSGYDRQGRLVERLSVPAVQATCPAFGGPDLSTLYVTSAAEGRPDTDTSAGCTFALATGLTGQVEHKVIL